MNKNYITPAVDVIQSESSELLAGTIIKEGSNNINQGQITDPSQIGAKKGNVADWDDEDDPASDGNLWNYSDPLN